MTLMMTHLCDDTETRDCIGCLNRNKECCLENMLSGLPQFEQDNCFFKEDIVKQVRVIVLRQSNSGLIQLVTYLGNYTLITYQFSYDVWANSE
jgi:hypothetical protein